MFETVRLKGDGCIYPGKQHCYCQLMSTLENIHFKSVMWVREMYTN